MTARILLIGAFLYFAALFGGLYVKLHAQEKCTPVDPAAMVWTGHGFSIAMGDGHLWINREDVVYAEVSQPHVCMPAKGMMQLLLPHAWPSYAGRDGAASASFRVAAPHPQMGVKQPSAATSSIILAHQKLASDGYPTFPESVTTAQYAPDSPEYQWIHANYPRCCNHLDCKPAAVEWTPHGWEVRGAEHYVAEKDAIPWPFGEPFACMVGGKVRCLFLNSGG